MPLALQVLCAVLAILAMLALVGGIVWEHAASSCDEP